MAIEWPYRMPCNMGSNRYDATTTGEYLRQSLSSTTNMIKTEKETSRLTIQEIYDKDGHLVERIIEREYK